MNKKITKLISIVLMVLMLVSMTSNVFAALISPNDISVQEGTSITGANEIKTIVIRNAISYEWDKLR